ncbi:MAG: hypothetical protein UR60_C0009G0001, partial [Candidatus Moranbacteria bacterium GW2011_GWF2_34_56]
MFKTNILINKISWYFLVLAFFGISSGFFGLISQNAEAQEISTAKHIFVFVREGCSACAKEESFLKTIKDKNIKVILLDITDKDNYANFSKIVEKNNLSKVTPITL